MFLIIIHDDLRTNTDNLQMYMCLAYCCTFIFEMISWTLQSAYMFLILIAELRLLFYLHTTE